MTHAPGTTRTGRASSQAWSTPRTIFLLELRGRFRNHRDPALRLGQVVDQPRFGLIGDPEPLPYVQPATGTRPDPMERSPPRSRRATPTTAATRPARHPGPRSAAAAARGRRVADRPRAAEGLRLVGRPGPRRLREVADRHGLPARRHPDLRRRRRPDRRRGAAGAGSVHARGRGGRAGIPGQRPAGRGHGGPRRGPAVAFFLPDGHEYQVILVVRGRGDHPDRPGRYGLDAGRGWARRPFIGSFVALLLGIGGGVAVWVLLNGANPLA